MQALKTASILAEMLTKRFLKHVKTLRKHLYTLDGVRHDAALW